MPPPHPLPARPAAFPQSPRAIAEEIDLLHGVIHSLCSELAVGTRTREKRAIESDIDAALTRLKGIRAYCSEGAQQGATAGPVRWDALAAHAANALRDVTAAITQASGGVATRTPLDVLPDHVHLLDRRESASFAADFAVVRMLLQSGEFPLKEENLATLLEAAARLAQINDRYRALLDNNAQPAAGNDPAQFRKWYESIDRFETALQTAVEEAVSSRPQRLLDGIARTLRKDELHADDWALIDRQYRHLAMRIQDNDEELYAAPRPLPSFDAPRPPATRQLQEDVDRVLHRMRLGFEAVERQAERSSAWQALDRDCQELERLLYPRRETGTATADSSSVGYPDDSASGSGSGSSRKSGASSDVSDMGSDTSTAPEDFYRMPSQAPRAGRNPASPAD